MTIKRLSTSLEQQVDRGYIPMAAQPAAKQPIDVKYSVALEKEPSYFVHKRGQTLTNIAREVTGYFSDWKEIAEYNGLGSGNERRSANKILLGQRLKIPEHLIRDSSSVSYLAEKDGAGWFDNGCVPTKHYTRSPNESFEDAVARVTGNPDDADYVIKYNRQFIRDFNRVFEEIYFPKELVRNPGALSSR